MPRRGRGSRANPGGRGRPKKVLQPEDQEKQDKRTGTKKQTPKQNAKASSSPAGSYAVDCPEIKDQWPDLAENLGLDIYSTGEPGIFQASFDFGVLEGVMVLGLDKNKVEAYCSRMDPSENEFEEDEEDEEEEEDEEDKKPQAGSKRKASSPQRGRGRPKKAKADKDQGLTYHLKLRCRETGEGEVYAEPDDGVIKFKDASLASFKGEADLPCVGSKIPFTARKVSDKPSGQPSNWADYSNEQHEYAQVARWH